MFGAGVGPKLRGGDGGAAVCGGYGLVASWLPFASSFAIPDGEVDCWYVDDALVRRLRALGPGASGPG